MLLDNLRLCGYYPAANYLLKEGSELLSFVESDNLMECFDWEESEQGYNYWSEIYWYLAAEGMQDFPDDNE